MSIAEGADVLVVGAGPVGLVSALVLAARGVQVQIIDQESGPAAHSYAVAIHPDSLALFETLGLIEPLRQQGRSVQRIGLYDQAGRRGELRLDHLDHRWPFVLIIRQDALEELLEQQLRLRGITVNWNHRLSSLAQDQHHVIAQIDRLSRVSRGYAVATADWTVERTLRVQAAFVIGADGHRSSVRRVLHVPYPEVAPARSYAVFEFPTPPSPPEDDVSIVFTPDTTNVLWTMPHEHSRWSLELPAGAASAAARVKSRLVVQMGQHDYPWIDAAQLPRLLAERAPWFTQSAGALHWSIAVRFERRLANEFGQGRCWLAGDAIHLGSPVGVQSMNVGLLEADALATAIASLLREGHDPTVLHALAARRMAEWRQLLGLEAPPTARPGTPDWLVNYLPRLVGSVPASGQTLVSLMAQLAVDLPAPRFSAASRP